MQRISKKIQRSESGSYRFGHFDLFPSERILRGHGRAISLQPKIFDALLVLVRSAERLVRKEELMEALWPETYVSEANLTNIVVALRKVLGRDSIETVPKHGYRFKLSIEGRPGVEQRAFATFARARDLTRERSIEAMMEARELYWLCIAKDPAFAEAWAWLGRCCRFLDKFGVESSVNLELAESAFHRAFAIDPDLACAHHFFTQLEADLGQAQRAMVRLLQRVSTRPHEGESFAGLVQVLRYCGLLDESVVAHRRAVALDPAIATSVPHTYFLRCEYEATIESYSGRAGYYLDAAAWAALGDVNRSIVLLRDRLAGARLSPLISGLMSSLLALLDGSRGEAIESMRAVDVVREPEVLFYFARHFAYLGMTEPAIELLRRAKSEGYLCSRALAEDGWLSSVRGQPGFNEVLSELKAAECEASRAFDQSGGSGTLKTTVAP